MRLSSVDLAAGLVLAAARGSAATEMETMAAVPRAEGGPGYFEVPVGTIPRARNVEKRAQGTAVKTVLENKDFFYAANIGIGTPPQNITVLVDTGSSELWVNPDCSTARVQDQDQCVAFGQYNPRKSRTPPVGPFGSETINFGDTTDASTLTTVDITYFRDRIAFGAAAITNQTFGVVTQSKRQSQGILGLAPDLRAGFDGASPYSLVLNSMAKQGVIASRVFSLDLRHSDVKTGALLYGGVDKSKFVGSLERRPMVRGVDGEFRLALSLDTLGITLSRSENYALQGDDTNVMLDSGTTISRLREDVAMPILQALGATTDGDGYFMVPCSMRYKQGSVDFGFGGKTIKVPFKDFILNVGDTYTCYVGVALTGGQQILGDTVLRAGYFVFDWDNEEIHLAQAADCADSDIVTLGKGKGAVPSGLEGNCKESDIRWTMSASTKVTQTLTSGGGGTLPTKYTVTACPDFDPNCQTGVAETPTNQATGGGAQPTGGSSKSNGGSNSSSDDKKNGAGRIQGALGSLLAAPWALGAVFALL